MLNHLNYSVTFPSTGRTLSGDFSFEQGFGAITGPNEAGKSIILEMIRYSLFGTSALRGKAEDYKNLKAELNFTVKGETYTTKRTITTARIFRGDTEIANGQKGVNSKVVEIFGYGLKVFDTTNVAGQGDIEKLGSMLPSERKQMVDSVIGLSAIDDLAKWCGQEASGIASVISGMEEGLIKPEKPEKPQGYRPTPKLAPELSELRGLRDELNQVKGRLDLDRMAKPAEPVEVPFVSEHDVDVARAWEAAQAEFNRLPEPPTEFSEDGIDDWELRERLKRDLPTMTAEQIAQADADMDLIRLFDRLEHFEKQLQDLIDVGRHTCPHCSGTWPIEGDRIEAVRTKVFDLQAELAGKVKPSKPDMVNIDVARRQLQAFDKVRDQWERVKDVERPRWTRQQVAQFQLAREAQDRLAALERPSATAKELNARWRARIAYEHDLASYEERLAQWERQEEAYGRDVVRAGELSHIPERVAKFEEAYQEAKIYEDRLATYKAQLVVYETRLKDIQERKVQEEGYRKGREALTILRRLVKQHLIPSLNKVASHYISRMTGGQRNVIEVNDDFEITVDGQPINTLSGSGKAVANLSLRLGLGQVLTNNVFSVFLGDEIDASMDKDRAEQTALTLEYLKERISQILLVSHKYPQADYYIELEANETIIH